MTAVIVTAAIVTAAIVIPVILNREEGPATSGKHVPEFC